jgi:hypothetical protein
VTEPLRVHPRSHHPRNAREQGAACVVQIVRMLIVTDQGDVDASERLCRHRWTDKLFQRDRAPTILFARDIEGRIDDELHARHQQRGSGTTDIQDLDRQKVRDRHFELLGLTEKQAAALGFEIQVLKVPITPLTVPRARTTGQMDGLLKATIEKSTQRILGCTIQAAEAGEMIGTVQAVMIAKMPASTAP